MKLIMAKELHVLPEHFYVAAKIVNISIRKRDSELEKLKEEAAKRAMEYKSDALISNPILLAYKDLHQEIGYSDFTPAAHALIDSVKRRGRLPRINCAVDAYNIVAVESFLAIGAHDADKVEGDIWFRFADGSEKFMQIGQISYQEVKKGDLVYADSIEVMAWLDAYDSETFKVTEHTKNIVITIHGNHATSKAYCLDALSRACDYIVKFCGGSYEIVDVLEE